MKLYLINGNDRYEVDAIFDGEISETLRGEAALRFSFSSETRNITDLVADGTVVEYNGQFYDVASYEFSGNHLAVICTLEAEHISYRLNNAEYNVESFAFGGTYAALLARILDGTGFTAGPAPDGSITGLVIDGVSRRELLMTAADVIGCEIGYDGWTINFVEHRGSTERMDLMDTGAVTGVSTRRNVLTGEVCYTVTLGKRGSLRCGDEVHITYVPFGLDADTRIIAIRYHPYNEYECSIDVGDYVPDIVDFYTDMSRRVLMKSDAKIEFEKYINSADGTAAISAALEGTYVTSDMLEDYVQTSELNTSIKQYINGAEGVASITSAVSGKFMAAPPTVSYSTPSGVTYGFEKTADGYYTSTNAGVDSSYSYGVFTFNNSAGKAQEIKLRCVSYGENSYDYGIISMVNQNLAKSNAADASNVLKSFKGASSVSPVDVTLTIPAGTSTVSFKYIKDGSQHSGGDYFKIMPLTGEYVTAPETSALIEQRVDAFGASLKLSVANGEKSSVISLTGDGISLSGTVEFTGEVVFKSDLSTAGSTTINGANIITGTLSADVIDTSELRVQEVYYYDESEGYFSILSSKVSGYNTRTMVGPKDIRNGFAQYLELYGTQIYMIQSGYDLSAGDSDNYSIKFDMVNRQITAGSSSWSIGYFESADDYNTFGDACFDYLYAGRIYCDGRICMGTLGETYPCLRYYNDELRWYTDSSTYTTIAR